MSMSEIAIAVGIIVLAGLLSGKIVQKFKAPMVIGFLITGILLGPSVLNVVTIDMSGELEILKVTALGVIAYTIGSELNFKKIIGIIRSIFVITMVQCIATFVLVFLSTYYLFNFPLPVALLLGAIAPASAPASPLAVSREYGARGKFTTTLLGTVAFLDAVTLTLFAIVSAVVGVILQGGEFSGTFLLEPLWEIGGSLVLGSLVGMAVVFITRYLTQKPQALAFLIGVVLINIGVANIWHLSPLLVNMATGIAVTNLSPPKFALHAFEDIEMFLYVCFFFLAGADLRLEVLGQAWMIVIGYIIIRGIGKVGGTFLGAKLARAEKRVQKYLGFALFTKAGLSVGLALMVQKSFPEISEIVVAIVLGAVVVCEIIGPLGTKFALISSGECTTVGKTGK